MCLKGGVFFSYVIILLSLWNAPAAIFFFFFKISMSYTSPPFTYFFQRMLWILFTVIVLHLIVEMSPVCHMVRFPVLNTVPENLCFLWMNCIDWLCVIIFQGRDATEMQNNTGLPVYQVSRVKKKVSCHVILNPYQF